nr:hypothetical protein [Tanacetum cinerariifolium]
MDSDSSHMMAASKVPMLKPDNGPTLLKTQVVEGVTTVMPITSVEDKAQRRLEDSKQLMEAIEKRFEILGEKISQEDVNQKLLRSLSLEWNTHVVVWRNKSDLDIMSMDDLNNNLKVYEPEVKVMSSSSTSTQNMTFVSSSNNNITNGAANTAQAVNTVIGVSSAGTQVNTANIYNLSDAVIYAFMASQPSSLQLVNEDLEQIHPDDLEEMDLKWKMAMLTMRARRECRAPRSQDTKYKESTRRTVPIETPALTTLVSCDRLGGYDWSDQAEEGPNFSLMAYTYSSSDSKIVDNYKKRLGYENYNAVPPPYTGNFMPPKPDLSFTRIDEFDNKPVVENSKGKSSQEKSKEVRKNIDSPIIKEWVSDDEDEDMIQPKFKQKTVKTSFAKIEFIKPKQIEGLSNRERKYVAPSHTKKIFRNMRRTWKGFSERITPLFPTMLVQSQIENVVDKAVYKELDDSLVRAVITASSLEAEQDSGNVNKTQSKVTPNESSSQRTDSGGGLRCLEAMRDTIAQTRSERVFKLSDDSLLARVSTATTTATISIDEVTLAQALAELKHTKPKAKAKGIVFYEPEESTTITKTIPKPKSQDKGKAIMIEELVKLKKKDQIMIDEEVSLKLQAELQAKFDKEQRLARKKAKKEEEANIAFIKT